MNHEEAIAKAVKFLKLAQSDNPNEAALAASRAQDIIDRFKLSIDMSVDGVEVERPTEAVKTFEASLYADEGKYLKRWKLTLASVVACANGCRVFFQGTSVRLVGHPSDAETVRYLFAWLAGEVDRLTERDAKGNGKSWSTNFRLGIVDTLNRRLQQQKAETVANVREEARVASGPNPHALMRVEKSLQRIEREEKEVDAFMEGLKLRKSNSRTSYNPSAREAGRRAGESITFNKSRGALGGGQ